MAAGGLFDGIEGGVDGAVAGGDALQGLAVEGELHMGHGADGAAGIDHILDIGVCRGNLERLGGHDGFQLLEGDGLLGAGEGAEALPDLFQILLGEIVTHFDDGPGNGLPGLMGIDGGV